MKNGMHVDDLGDKWWYKNGLRHRLDGPAVEWTNGDKWWYRNDMLHREDGPAIENANGDKEWWVNGKSYSFDEWLEKMNFSDEEKLFLKLKWV